MLKNGTPASPATAFARSVLPVPGGPTRITPLGILAPRSVYFLGFLRKSTISSSSSFSSLNPATCLNVTLTALGSIILARLLPKFIILELLPPPAAACLFINTNMNIITAATIINGNIVVRNTLSRCTSPCL